MAALTLTEKLDQLGTRYDELTQELSSAEIVLGLLALPKSPPAAIRARRNRRQAPRIQAD